MLFRSVGRRYHAQIVATEELVETRGEGHVPVPERFKLRKEGALPLRAGGGVGRGQQEDGRGVGAVRIALPEVGEQAPQDILAADGGVLKNEPLSGFADKLSGKLRGVVGGVEILTLALGMELSDKVGGGRGAVKIGRAHV